MRLYLFIVSLVCVLFAPLAAQNNIPTCPGNKMAELEWLQGKWQCNMGGRLYVEGWALSACGSITGEGNFVRTDTIEHAESLLILPVGNKLVYIASPAGQEPALFRFVEADERHFLVVNEEHDFPKRILYTVVNKNELTATVDGVLRGEKKSFTYLFTRIR